MPVQFDSNYPTLTVWADFPAPIGSQDITEHVINLEPYNGAQGGEQSPRFTASAVFTLNNWDGRFSRSNLAGAYVSGGVSFVRPKVGIRVVAEWASTTYALWRGRALTWVDDWRGDAQIEGFDSQVVLTCEGLYGVFASSKPAPSAPVGAGERSGARVSRILTAFGWSGGTSIAVGSVPLIATTLEGDGISQILQVVDTEGGAFYIEPDGTAVFEDRSSLVVNTRSRVSQATFSQSSVFFRAAQPVSGDDKIVNDVRLQGADGALGAAADAASDLLYGTLSWGLSGLPTDLSVHLQAAAEFNVARWKDPQAVVPSVTIDAVQSPSLLWPHALGRRIHDRVTVTAFNARSGVTVSHDAFIVGVSHSISQNRWETTFHLADATAWTSFSAHLWDTGVWDTARWFY
jgi:hypothetical protein